MQLNPMESRSASLPFSHAVHGLEQPIAASAAEAAYTVSPLALAALIEWDEEEFD